MPLVAIILAAPSSTKNETQSRDPQMTQTKKGNTCYFGMKAHMGADAKMGLIHTVVTTMAAVHDAIQEPQGSSCTLNPLLSLLYAASPQSWRTEVRLRNVHGDSSGVRAARHGRGTPLEPVRGPV